jgi:hypothetical protein
VDNCRAFLQYFLTGGRGPAERTDPGVPEAHGKQDAGKAVTDALKLSNRIVPIRSIAGNITLDASVSLGDKALKTAAGLTNDLIEMAGLSEAAQRAVAFARSKAESLSETLIPKIVDLTNAFIEGLSAAFDKSALKEETAATLDAWKEQCKTLVEEAIRENVPNLPEVVGGKITETIRGKIRTLLVAKGAETEEGDGEAAVSVQALESAMQKALVASLSAVGAEAKAPEEEESKWVDVALAAQLTLGGQYETRRPAANMETVTTGINAGASASATLGLAGASLSKSAEAHFSASLERRFTDAKLTGATMSRRYEIGGETAAEDAGAILASFGLSNRALERDIRGELGEYETVRLIVDAEMTREGMERYREAQEAKSTAKSMLILSDRNNYRNTEIRIETPATAVNAERSLEAEADVSVLGEGGGLKVGFRIGAKGELINYRRYNATNRPAETADKPA